MALLTLELDPNFAPAYRLLSLAYQGMKDFDKAIVENHRWGELTANKIKADIAFAEITALAGNKEPAAKLIEEIVAGKNFSANDYRGMSHAYVALGDADKAFMWLEKSYEHHEESLCSLKIDPKMIPLREDARFKELLKKIGLEE